nr:hypothetical protein Iba_chr04bCG8020 [Ipomoea batatas]
MLHVIYVSLCCYCRFGSLLHNGPGYPNLLCICEPWSSLGIICSNYWSLYRSLLNIDGFYTTPATDTYGNGSRWVAAIIFFGCQQAYSSSHQEHCSDWFTFWTVGILHGC